MVKKNAGRSLLLTASMTGSSLLWAQGPGGGQAQPRPVLLTLDTDHNGTLSAAEIAAASASLAKLDANSDGRLTSLEFLPPQVDSAATDPDALLTRLMALDHNGDGVLTPDEIPERLQRLMTRADSNHDGKLTQDEIRAYAKTQTGPLGRPQQGSQVTRMDPVLSALDTNHDGILSAAEIANAPSALRTLDLNGDGQLTPDETRMKQMTPADRAAHLLDEWDTNKDGKLSKLEAPDRIQEQFDRIDTNHDSLLELTELTAYFASQPAQRSRTAEAPRPADGPRQP